MTEHSNANLIFRDANGTSNCTFRTIGVAENWHSVEVKEQEDVFTQDKFENALKKVSRKVKK